MARTCPLCRRCCVPPAQLDGVVMGKQRLGVNLVSLIVNAGGSQVPFRTAAAAWVASQPATQRAGARPGIVVTVRWSLPLMFPRAERYIEWSTSTAAMAPSNAAGPTCCGGPNCGPRPRSPSPATARTATARTATAHRPTGPTKQVALPVAYHTSVVAGQQVPRRPPTLNCYPRRPPVGPPGRSWTRQMWPIAHGDLHGDVSGCGDPHHQRCARVRVVISDTIRARILIWDIACSRSSPFRFRRYRRKVCLNWRVPF